MLNDNDRQRIADWVNNFADKKASVKNLTDMAKCAEYATIYEREQQTKRITELEQEVKTLRGILKTELLDDGE